VLLAVSVNVLFPRSGVRREGCSDTVRQAAGSQADIAGESILRNHCECGSLGATRSLGLSR